MYKYITKLEHIHIHINLFLHELPFSKTKINLAIHHIHNGLNTIAKIKIYLRLFFQRSCFTYCQLIKYIFSCFLKWKSVGSSLVLKGISFKVLRAEYENPFFAYSRLYLGIWIFLQNCVCIWSGWTLDWTCSIDFLGTAY